MNDKVKVAIKNKSRQHFSDAVVGRVDNSSSKREQREKSFNRHKKATKNNQTDASWVRMSRRSEDSGFTLRELGSLAILNALYPNRVPKARGEVDDQGNIVAIWSKFDPDFRNLDTPLNGQKYQLPYDQHLDENNRLFIEAFNANVLTGNEEHIAYFLSRMYVGAEHDANVGNFSTNGNMIDFEFSFVDFGGGFQSGVPSTFTGKHSRGTYFLVHPMDLKGFPSNIIIAKPRVALNLEKTNPAHLAKLGEWSRSETFKKIAYRNLIKPLLFDKKMIGNILASQIEDTGFQGGFCDYLEKRFEAIKIALVQTDEFVTLMCDETTYQEFHDVIVEEFNEYNKDFIKGKEKYQYDTTDVGRAKYQYYKDGEIQIDGEGGIKNKLENLRKMAQGIKAAQENNCPSELKDKFKKSFNIDFDAQNKFHQYALKMLVANGDCTQDELFKLIATQVARLAHHLENLWPPEPYEENLLKQLKQVSARTTQLGSLKKAEILFFMDASISEQLVAKQNNAAAPAQNISDSWYNAARAAVDSKSNEVSKRLVEQSQSTPPPSNTVYETPIMSDILCPEAPFFQNYTSSIEEENLFSKLNLLLQDCVAYSKQIKDKGDVLLAAAFMEKIAVLYELLDAGMKNNKTPQDVAKAMIIEVNKPDALLGKHQGWIAWFVTAIMNIFRKPELQLADNGSVKRYTLPTERVRKLAQVVETVNALPTLRAH